MVAAIIIASLSACGSGNTAELSAELKTEKESVSVLKTENGNLKSEIEQLKKEIDELKNGPDKMLAAGKLQFEKEDLNGLNTTLSSLKSKHPDSEHIATLADLSARLTTEIEKENKRIAAEAKAKEEEEKARLAAATGKMRKEYDEITERTFYTDKTSAKYVNSNSFHIYFGTQEGSSPWLRIAIRYTGDDWVFMDSYTIKADDETYTVSPSYGEIQRDNGYSGVWEYYDGNVSKYEMEMIKAIISSKKTLIRHQGDQFHYDRTVTAAEKKALQNVLDAYKAMGGVEPS
ncbi:hypothetical protein D3P09_02155 [Paenibacillus pinisoli]|uniref:Uncharacterized protein n=2 Tax=Paenibacillus pinisoli TaxID=1276110 RepID=A0A3A6PI23_9BACL|nr:hypothetical protein D3P09_02155 [Paenibacillus pinisoli]